MVAVCLLCWNQNGPGISLLQQSDQAIGIGQVVLDRRASHQDQTIALVIVLADEGLYGLMEGG